MFLSKFLHFVWVCLLAFSFNASADIDTELKSAHVFFEVQRNSGSLELIGKELGEEKFKLSIADDQFNKFGEYSNAGFQVKRLENLLYWQHMVGSEFYQLTVSMDGNVSMTDLPQTYSGFDQGKIYAFKTSGTLENRGSQAFRRLVLSCNAFHNYGTIQMGSYFFSHNYSFNTGVLKSGELPAAIADLRTPEMKASTATPQFKDGVIDNYGEKISKNKTRINSGLNYHEHSQSVFKELEMVGGDIAVNGGSTVISGTLSGTIRDVAVTGEGCLHIGRYDAVRTGKYSADGGTIYTSDMKKLEQDITDLEKEQVMFANFSKSTRVTPEEALRRYQLIKDGKVSQLYDPQTLSNLQKDAGDHWMEVAAMDLYGLKGGGKFWKNFGKALGLVASVAVPFVAPVLAPVAAVGMAVSMSAIDGRSHSVGVATDGNNVAVGVDGGASHVLHQKQKAEQKHNQLLEGAQVPAPLRKMKSTYERAVEGMPERIRLAREIRGLFKPVDCYHPKYHKFRPAPEEQIARAFALTGDAKPYLRNRDHFSSLYDALRASHVSQGDIASIWADPYLETVRSWERVASERRLRLKSEYPEMEVVANAYHKLAAQYRPASSLPDTIPSEGLEDCSLDFALCFCSGVGSFLKQVGREAFEKFATRSVAKALIANEGKIQKAAGKLLKGEGNVGSYGELISKNKKLTQSGLAAHHMPSKNYIKKYGIKGKDGVCMNVSQSNNMIENVPNRHSQTRTYGVKARFDSKLSPRDELAADIKDIKQIYKKDGLYNDKIRDGLLDVIKQNEKKFPEIFKKGK